MKLFQVVVSALLSLVLLTSLVLAETGDESKTQNLAKQLANPVASLISIPFQSNWESGLGAAGNGNRYTLRLQPVIPFSFNADYNLIVRPIFSYISQQDVIGGTGQRGLSDTQLELFWSPKTVGSSRVIWGLGPTFLLPTAAEPALGTGKWGLGPSAVVLKQSGPWTYGALSNHLWAVAGNSDRSNISQTYLQPFISHSNKKGLTFSLSSESSYDWLNSQWTIPAIGTVSQIMPIAGHYVSFGLSGVYNLQSPTNTNKWATRLTITLLLPDK